MRHLTQTIVLILGCLTAVMTQSCDNDEIWDIAPVDVVIDIQDARGRSQLNPESTNNIIGESVTMDFEGKQYEVDWEKYLSEMPSKQYLAAFNGITFGKQWVSWDPVNGVNNFDWRIRIGELPGDESYEKVFRVTYQGVTHEILVVNRFKSNKKKTLYYLDGKKLDNNHVNLIKI